MVKNDLSKAQDAYYYGVVMQTIEAAILVAGDQSRSPSEREHILHEQINLAFTVGAKWSIKQTGQLSPYIAKFIEMMILLGFLEREEIEEQL